MSGPEPLAAGPAAAAAALPAPETKLYDVEDRWSVQVKVGGVPASIYQVEHEVRKTTCYIVAEEGKEFEVRWQREQSASTDECVRLHVDGTLIGNGITKRQLSVKDDYTFLGNYISPTQLRPFVFAPIALTDDPSAAATDKAVLVGLGSIQVDLHRITILDKSGHQETYKDVTKGPLVDEKTKKARMSHATGFGEARTAPAIGDLVNVLWTDPVGGPYYSLVFKYRSKTLLELEGILEGEDAPEEEPVQAARNDVASASASPSVEPGARGSSATGGKKYKKRKKIELTLADSSDEEDGADLRAKVAKLEAENAKLRNAVKADPDGVRVKPEPGVKEEYNVKVTTENGKVVLDLLDD